MIFEYKEDVIYAYPSGIFRGSSRIEVKRKLSHGKWILNSTQDDQFPSKKFEECKSFIHPSVNEWDSAEKRLEGVEATVVSKRITRKVTSRVDCIEEKVVNYVELNNIKFGYTGNISDVKAVIDFLKYQQSPKIKERKFGLERVKAVLDPEATAHLFHNIISLLRGDLPKLKEGERLFGLDVKVYDDPLNSNLVGFSVFDDEGVKTNKRVLIEDGTIVNYLGTLTSTYGEPGNARGSIPSPDYFNLDIKGGEWKFDEIIEDTKGGIIIIGANRSEIIGNSIRIFPRDVIQIGGKGIVAREIAIPIQELASMDSLSKETRSSFIDENHGAMAPFSRLMVRVMIY
ncbi:MULTISPECIES: metallopeptidase TldD-related protein [Acidianus]|uniref:Metalloprotease TldD/E C-terminal domain-containing protein n=1 Tax=Candidatus Acidianus copahuensis TaxID=1160895 RepID=A0A031LM93_9CREN|nr:MULTISPECIES: metallopeptidase TldD-related protein [Acidianus]EZQ02018.1 hypothetical protein CM19_11120 [Candidatus Acidianus copahuensis]NON61525.1 hypothetical protein [Acidianus sp. RZ1]